MPTYNVTPSTGGTASVAGTRPFAKRLVNDAWEVRDANGVAANPDVNGQGSEQIYSQSSAAQAVVDAIVTAANNSPVNTVAPAITGTAQVGQQLATTGGTWTGTPAPTKTYQWYAGGVAIAGATAANYTHVVGDIGKTITVTVTGTNTAGTATANSAATAAVIAA